MSTRILPRSKSGKPGGGASWVVNLPMHKIKRMQQYSIGTGMVDPAFDQVGFGGALSGWIVPRMRPPHDLGRRSTQGTSDRTPPKAKRPGAGRGE